MSATSDSKKLLTLFGSEKTMPFCKEGQVESRNEGEKMKLFQRNLVEEELCGWFNGPLEKGERSAEMDSKQHRHLVRTT